jgi:hypothetical protein
VQLQRQLGLNRYESAGTMLHKLRRAMVNPERTLLTGEVEVMSARSAEWKRAAAADAAG